MNEYNSISCEEVTELEPLRGSWILYIMNPLFLSHHCHSGYAMMENQGRCRSVNFGALLIDTYAGNHDLQRRNRALIGLVSSELIYSLSSQ